MIGILIYGIMVLSPFEIQEGIKNPINEHIGFEKNMGQMHNFQGGNVEDVILRANLPGYSIFISKNGISYVIYKIEKVSQRNYSYFDEIKPSILKYARIDVEFINSKILEDSIEYDDPLPGYKNYYLANCPDGILGVRTYRKVRIKNIYPKIDWLWIFEDGKLHHQFEVRKGAKISDIKFRVKYADVEIKGGKKLILSTPLGKIEDGEIYAYEIKGSKSLNCDVFYKMDEDGTISFDVKNYSYKNTLIIDPPLSLLWATWFGGSFVEIAYSITSDLDGNIFLTGFVFSRDFPTLNPGGGAYYQGENAGWSDIFISKFNNSGVMLWSTYYGGSDGENGYSLATDDSGNLFLAGATASNDFPTFNPGGNAYYQGEKGGIIDAVILKFDNKGVRKWATYYGGNDEDYAYSIAIDFFNNIFLTGMTYSTNFPTYDPGGGTYYQPYLRGYCDIFILKFNNYGTRLWATYYGGSGYDRGNCVTSDISGNIFLTGRTGSNNFPTYRPDTNAYYQNYATMHDAFILKFNNSGIRLWATYYGGSGYDNGTSIITDYSGNIFVTGETTSINFPTYNPGSGAYFQEALADTWGDLFILKFDNKGVRKWATYYGGNDFDISFSIAIDRSKNIFITGLTASSDFPTLDPGEGAYYQDNPKGNGEIFILTFSNSGVRKWATYYGGSDYDHAFSIATDPSGNVFLTGYTYSWDFPTLNPGGRAYYKDSIEYEDAFILKFEFLPGKSSGKFERVNLLHTPLSQTFFDDKIILRFLKPQKKYKFRDL